MKPFFASSMVNLLVIFSNSLSYKENAINITRNQYCLGILVKTYTQVEDDALFF